MDKEAIKKALASDKLEERLLALDQLSSLEAQIKERDDLIAKNEQEFKAIKKREQELQETNQKLFLRVSSEVDKNRRIQSGGNVISPDDEDDDLLTKWINEAKAKAKVG